MSFICYRGCGCTGCKHLRKNESDELCCWAKEDGKILDLVISKLWAENYQGKKKVAGTAGVELELGSIAAYGFSEEVIKDYACVRGIEISGDKMVLTIYDLGDIISKKGGR